MHGHTKCHSCFSYTVYMCVYIYMFILKDSVCVCVCLFILVFSVWFGQCSFSCIVTLCSREMHAAKLDPFLIKLHKTHYYYVVVYASLQVQVHGISAVTVSQPVSKQLIESKPTAVHRCIYEYKFASSTHAFRQFYIIMCTFECVRWNVVKNSIHVQICLLVY